MTAETPADVLIIGAGAGGGVAALHLVNNGCRVVALEQGHWQDRTQYPGANWDWELAAGKQWSPLPNVRRNDADYPVDISASDMDILNFNGVGGGTVLYNAIWPRLLPENFRSRSALGIADDWPLDYRELQPWYEETDRQVGVSGFGGNPLYPEGAAPPLPPLPFNPGALRVARALHRRRWHWWPDTNAILSVPHDGRHQCVQRGTCGQGCNEGAKSSFDLTHWQKFVSAGGELITGARVTRITVDDRGLASGALWLDEQGAEHFQPARVVLCAANGIGTARLLLNSACERFPSGLANSSDLVGRNLMLHPLGMAMGYFDEQLRGWQGQNGSTVQCQEFGLSDATRGFRGGAKWALHPMGGGPLLEATKLLAAGVQGDDYHRLFARRLGHGLMWSILVEDLPSPENRVLLDPNHSDSSGMPGVRLNYRYGADVLANLAWNLERAETIFREAGAWHVESFSPAGVNAHLTGTARMGDDPATSVVDRWGMSHDVPNLGIVDGSVFVTCGAVNPTSTIAALALRAADHLVRTRHRLPSPSLPARSPARGAVGRARGQAPALVIPSLTDHQRARLAALGDGLIAAVAPLPGAGTLVVERNLVAKVLSRRPDLGAPLVRALAADTTGQLQALAAADPEAWSALVTVVAGGYYTEADVKERIGYDGQVASPLQPDGYPAYISEGLLDHLLDGTWEATWQGGLRKSSAIAAT